MVVWRAVLCAAFANWANSDEEKELVYLPWLGDVPARIKSYELSHDALRAHIDDLVARWYNNDSKESESEESESSRQRKRVPLRHFLELQCGMRPTRLMNVLSAKSWGKASYTTAEPPSTDPDAEEFTVGEIKMILRRGVDPYTAEFATEDLVVRIAMSAPRRKPHEKLVGLESAPLEETRAVISSRFLGRSLPHHRDVIESYLECIFSRSNPSDTCDLDETVAILLHHVIKEVYENVASLMRWGPIAREWCPHARQIRAWRWV